MVEYSPELGRKVCELIATGMTPSKISELDGMPSADSVYKWCIRHPDFLKIYDEAREKQMEVYSNQIIDLSDNVRADADCVAKAKLQLHARQWLMGKLKPKKYGDSTTIKGDKDNPLTIGLAAALDTAIAQRAAGKTIEHIPSEGVPRISQAVACDTDSEENE